jgi:LmbE family N-acetylglucosaminyl deacetylase
MVFVSLGGIELWRRQNLYWYDVRQDYRLNFASERTMRVPAEISNTGFVVPPIPGNWDTAVLRLRLSSTLAGVWFEPSVMVEGAGFASRQFLERAAQGRRYLSLATDRLMPGDHVTLEGRHLKWDSQIGELLLFRNPPLDARTLLVLAPHPDDAEIAAFGLYSESGAFIATVTAGNYVDGLYAHIYSGNEQQDTLRGDLRTWDSIAIPQLGGVIPEQVVNLGYGTNSLQKLYQAGRDGSAPDPRETYLHAEYRRGAVRRLLGEIPESPNWSMFVADLAALLDAVAPDAIVAPHPALDAAPDHQFTTIALLEALDQADTDQSVLYLYTNHHVLTEYYPFGPSDSIVTLPPWFDTGTHFATVYSHPLDEHMQVRKLFALDAMHDLRAAPDRFVGGPTERFLGRLNSAAKQVIADPLGTYSYFRRATRPNELFFVYEANERELLRSFIAANPQYQ